MPECFIPVRSSPNSLPGLLVRTLVAVAVDDEVIDIAGGIYVEKPCSFLAEGIRTIASRKWGEVAKLPPVPRARRDIVDKILAKLGVVGATSISIRDLLEYCAKAIEAESSTLSEEMDSIALCRAEFYEYPRTSSIATSRKSKDEYKLPIIEQALALAGYSVSSSFLGNGDTLNLLLLAWKNLEGIREGYLDALRITGSYTDALRRKFSISSRFLQLAIASKIVESYVLYPWARFDVFGLAHISGGGTYTVINIEQIATSRLVKLLEKTSHISTEFGWRDAHDFLRKLSYSLAELLGLLSGRVNIRGISAEKIQGVRNTVARFLEEYSTKIVLFSETGSKSLLYDAARIAAGVTDTLSRIDKGRPLKLYVRTKDGVREIGLLTSRTRLLAEVASILAFTREEDI